MGVNKLIKDNCVVAISYKIISTKGNILEQVDIPIYYLHNVQTPLFLKIHRALHNKKIGDEVKVALNFNEAFGPHMKAFTFTDDIDNVPPQFRKVGAEIVMQNNKNESKKFIVSKIKDRRLTVDGNHLFAGLDLVFIVNVLSIRQASEAEIASDNVIKQQVYGSHG